MAVTPEEVVAASGTLAVLTAVISGLACAFVAHQCGVGQAVLAAAVGAAATFLVREAVSSYPRTAAARRAASVLRSSTEGVNTMIMSLRHEASLPKAMRAAGGVDSEFGREMRSSIWSVMMGLHSSFEDSLQAVAARWGDHSRELKSAFHSLITASCEGSEAGRRNALDRASRALVSGARRRIEDYALGLALPSMMLFSIGVLLPLMVGSFLPMLSWDMWSAAGDPQPIDPGGLSDGTLMRTVLVMNLVFPAVALMIAMDAMSRHPMARVKTVPDGRGRRSDVAALACAAVFASAGVAASANLLDDTDMWMGATLSCVMPLAAWLLVSGGRGAHSRATARSKGAEDLLFSIGARLAEGENLESAAKRTAVASGRPLKPIMLEGGDAVLASLFDTPSKDSGVSEAARVVAKAAARNEAQAGILAMDLSRYIRDLSDLEDTLRRRLRPTVSMMRLTGHVLAPIMLGITYAIYLSLASIGEGDFMQPGTLFAVLGVFLAETNAVVAYFVWGIGDGGDASELRRSIGSCVGVALLIFSATVLVAC